MKPFCCPVCNGHGTTIRPPNVAGDIVTRIDSWTPNCSCPACTGTGIVWGPPSPDFAWRWTITAPAVAPAPAVVMDPQHDRCDPREPCSTGCPAGMK